MKTTIRLSGRLMSPLMKGASAKIAYGGQVIRTSRVMKITESNDDEACFETAGAVYRVSYIPIAMSATITIPVAHAA